MSEEKPKSAKEILEKEGMVREGFKKEFEEIPVEGGPPHPVGESKTVRYLKQIGGGFQRFAGPAPRGPVENMGRRASRKQKKLVLSGGRKEASGLGYGTNRSLFTTSERPQYGHRSYYEGTSSYFKDSPFGRSGSSRSQKPFKKKGGRSITITY